MKAAEIILAENYLLNMVVPTRIGRVAAITGPSSRHLIDTMAAPALHARAGGDA